MSTNVIRQIVSKDNKQTIRMIVRSNERGPKGDTGPAGPQGPQGIPGERGADGAIQYRAGTGINIDEYNIISATGEAIATWGGIQGTIANQSDLAPYIKKEAPVWYGTCTTAGASFVKNITTEKGNFGYNEGDILIVSFTNGNTSSNQPMLMIDSGIGASVNMPAGWGTDYSGIWESGETVAFVYQKVNNTPCFFPISKTRATTSSYGMTKLYDNYDSSSTVFAPTANALKNVYDSVPSQVWTTVMAPNDNEYIGTANIADEAVTKTKIDLSTLDGNYSTTEFDTGYTWVDGKTIYKKTINFGALPNTTMKSVSHGISNIDYVLKIEGIAKRDSDGVFFQIGNSPNPTVGITTAISVTADSDSVDITTGTDRSGMNGYVTLWYTKSA